MAKMYKVPVAYQMYGYVRIPDMPDDATEEDALDWAEAHCDELELPYGAEYVDGSFEIDREGFVQEIRIKRNQVHEKGMNE